MAPPNFPDDLPAPARYLPLPAGRYQVKTGLHALGADFGNGGADGLVFQLDRRWPVYRSAKLAARAERLGKYVGTEDLSPSAQRHLLAWLVERLLAEHPALFRGRATEDHGLRLECALSGETLVFDGDFALQAVESESPVVPPYVSGLDALACQVQEDLAFTEIDADGRDRLSFLHLCLPNHWAAEDKLGGSFMAVHGPVPEMDRIHRQSAALLRALVMNGPFVRFAWGLATDTRLNHHPEPPAGTDPADWRGRRFDPAAPRLYLRVERQVTVGLPKARAFLFGIRTYFENVAELAPQQRRQLANAIQSMTAETLAYKGIAPYRDAVLAWLRGG